MNFQFYLKKLQSSNVFKEFMKENPKAYLCSGFFTIDKEGQDNQRHLDFYIPEKEEVFSFKFEGAGAGEKAGKIEKIPVEMINKKAHGKIKLDLGLDFDFGEIEQMIFSEMDAQSMKNKLQKIIFSLQSHEGKNFLVCTVFVSMLGLLKVNIDLEGKQGKPEITLFEKKSFFDLLKRVK